MRLRRRTHAGLSPTDRGGEALRIPRVLVVGTGALGCLFAATLTRAGRAQVRLCGRWREAIEAARRSGILLERDGADPETVPVSAGYLDDIAPRSADIVLVLVKSYQTAAVAALVASALDDHAVALTLQNGLGNRETLAVAAGPDRVAVGVTTAGATLLAPAHVRALPGDVVLGAEGRSAAAIQSFAKLLRRAGFDTFIQADIQAVVWAKLAVNCAINPLSALFGLTNGALLADPRTRDELLATAREVAAVAAGRGIRLPQDAGRTVVEIAERTSTNRSSMLQDFDRGRPTEIDALNGAVVAEARRLGMTVPLNESLWMRVRQRETEAQR